MRAGSGDSARHPGATSARGEEGAAQLPPFLDQPGPKRRGPEGLPPVQLLAEYGTPGPDGITIMLGAMAEKAGSG